MVALRALTFLALLFYCNARRTNIAAKRHVKQQSETSNHASNGFVPVVGAPGRLGQRDRLGRHSHLSHRPKVPRLGQLSMHQDRPHGLTRRQLLGFAGLGALAFGADWANAAVLGQPSDVALTEEQKAQWAAKLGITDPSTRSDTTDLMSGLDASQRQEITDLTNVWMKEMRQTMNRMSDLTPKRWAEITDRANVRMSEMSDPKDRETLMSLNGLILQDGDEFSDRYVSFDTEKFMKQILSDLEKSKPADPNAMTDTMNPFQDLTPQKRWEVTEAYLETNTKKVMMQLFLEIEESREDNEAEATLIAIPKADVLRTRVGKGNVIPELWGRWQGGVRKGTGGNLGPERAEAGKL